MDLIPFVPDLRKNILNLVSVLTEQSNWGLDYVNAEEAWAHSTGKNVKVAIIDTGWTDHKDLTPNFLTGYDATGNNDFIDRGSFHGTHVAGIIAANCGDNPGVKGVAPDAKLIPIKALDDSGCGSFDYINKALEIVRDLDVDVINMSLGSPVKPDNDRMENLIKEISNQGKIIVAAAGNDGKEVNYPARYIETVTVAAVEKTGELAKFSSRGPQLDTAAPGVEIYSTWNNNQYILLSGTSMACPCITGIVALIVSWYKEHPDPNFKINQETITKLLFDLSGPEGTHLIQAGQYDIGVPKMYNFHGWDK